MKKLIILILPVLLLVGCEDWLDVNTDPNNPTEVPAELVLPAAEVSVATRVGGTMFNYAGFFAQYWTQAPEANQYNKIDNYDINSPFLNTDYIELFAGALSDLEVVRDEAIETEEMGMYLAATALRAYTFQIWVDLIGEVPYTEALQGLENKSPHYDEGNVVYEGIIGELIDAIEKYSNSTNQAVTPNDLILNGDNEEWLAFANSLLLKLYMRASNVNDYSTEVMDLINQGGFISQDIKVDIWETQPHKHNPWYETNKVGLGTVNNIAALPITSYMAQKGDPRLAAIFTDVSGVYVGGVPAIKKDLTDEFSHPIIDPVQPVYLMTQTEVELFIAEAHVRFDNDLTAAQAAYEAAIDYNMALHGLGSGAALYGTGGAYEWDGSATDLVEQIAMQKWVSLCLVNNLEGWIEMRRLGYPVLSDQNPQDVYDDITVYTAGELISPSGNVLGFGNMIQRCPYPEESTRLNTNAPEQKNLTTPIWWDNN